MDTFWLSTHTDLAVFHVKPLNDTAVNQAVVRTVGLDLQPPTVGSRVNGWGQRNSSSAISINESGSLHYEINGEGAATVGEVREYHPTGTDTVLRPFPCCRVNARFDGGMSGGPIFLDNGKLGGIICSNLPPYDNNDEHCSYVTALWPLLAMNINIDPTTGLLVEEQYLFYELVKSGFVNVINLDKVLVTRQEETGLYNFAYVGN